jgi:hypothetical protein
MPVAARARIEALVEDLGSRASVARALGVDRSRVTRWLADETPDDTNLRRLEAVELTLARLLRLYDRETALHWLEGWNAHLGDRRPIDLLTAGRLPEVLAAVDAEESGGYA